MGELFDMIAGSETGAIIAASLVVPNDNPATNDTQPNKYWASKSANFFTTRVDTFYVDSAMPEGIKVLITGGFFIITSFLSFKIGKKCYSDPKKQGRLMQL